MTNERKNALAELADKLDDLTIELQELLAEEQAEFDRIPDKMRSGDLYEKVEESLEALEDAVDNIDEAIDNISLSVELK